MTIAEILEIEEGNSSKIHLFPQGNFYQVYEHSAFLFHTHVSEFRLSRRYYSKVNRYVISLGIPIQTVKKWLYAYPLRRMSDSHFICDIDIQINELEYQKWTEIATIEVNHSANYTPHTSIIMHSPVWGVAYALMCQVLEFTKHISKNVKEPFGSRIKNLVFDICNGIRILYDVKDRNNLIISIQDKCAEVMLLLQLFRDLKEISIPTYAQASERIVSVSKQLEGLRRKVKAEEDGAGLIQQSTVSHDLMR